MGYIIERNDELSHSGKKGMKWGYNDGKPNGKRTAEEDTDRTINRNNSVKFRNPASLNPETEEAITKYVNEKSENLTNSIYDKSPIGVQFMLDFMSTPITELFKTGVRNGAYKDK